MICDRGISAEGNRHRRNSITEMSTRYCNFSKNKFGNEISIIKNLDVTEYETVEARCFEVIVMNKKEYETFKNNLLKDWNFLEGLKCGTGSDYEPEREVEHIWQLTREEMEMWQKHSYRVATMIFNKDTNEKFYVNTEGYSYARYCLFD